MAKPRGKPFTGKGDPRNGPKIAEQLERKKKEVPPFYPPADDGASYLLQCMRRVFQNVPEYDTEPSHCHLRDWLEKDRTGYIRQLNLFEAKHKEYLDEQRRAKDEVEVDLGTDRAIALCEEWLRANGAPTSNSRS